MKSLKLSIGIIALILFSFNAVACSENKKSESKAAQSEIKSEDGHNHEHNQAKEMGEMNSSKMDQSNMVVQKSPKSNLIIAGYLQLKNALVNDDSKEAAVAAAVLIKDFKGFDASSFTAEQQKEIAEIIENASEQVEHIADNANKIDHQREHFEVLSTDVNDLITIVGTDKTLYVDYCPMVKASWLSEYKEIKNPFYGSKMLTCGSIQKEI